MELLLGPDGNSGIVSEIKNDLRVLKELALKGRYVILGMAIAIMVMQILTGTGVVSLKSLLSALSH